jgi:hypothetical protein
MIIAENEVFSFLEKEIVRRLNSPTDSNENGFIASFHSSIAAGLCQEPLRSVKDHASWPDSFQRERLLVFRGANELMRLLPWSRKIFRQGGGFCGINK